MIVVYGTHASNDIISRWFFHFFKILIFQVTGVVKGQEMVQNDKEFCPSCLISQEPYIMWLSFMVHLCKMIISPGVFIIFSIFWFFGLLGGKSVKTVQNKKFCLSRFISQEPYIIWLSFMVHLCKMIIYLDVFFIFSNCNFPGC